MNEIEHEIIRPKFKEPRIHFALVCAAMGCPPLLNEAFTGEKLDRQLDYLAKEFLNNPQKNEFDVEKRVTRISKIFDWYEKDFGDNKQDVLRFVADYLPQSLAQEIRANPDAWKVEYKDYDWSLNEVEYKEEQRK